MKSKTDMILVAETIDDRIQASLQDLLAVAHAYARVSDGTVRLLLPGRNVLGLAESLSTDHGIDVIALENDALRYPNPPMLAASMGRVLKRFEPTHVCLPHTMRACQTAAILSQQHNLACITAVEEIKADRDAFLFSRPVFNGKLMATFSTGPHRTVFTVIGGAFPSPGVEHLIEGAEVVQISAPASSDYYRPIGVTEIEDEETSIEEAEVIVAAGSGVGSEENIELLRKVAGIFKNSMVAGSRTACDAGWLPYGRQVGETGRQVSPRLYMACGISGARQHLAGIKNAQVVVAVNTDPQAAIFTRADFGVVEDLTQFLPLLAEKYRERINTDG